MRIVSGRALSAREARLDPAVPVEDGVGTLGDLVGKGHIRQVRLSDAGATTIRRAHAVHPITAIQMEYR